MKLSHQHRMIRDTRVLQLLKDLLDQVLHSARKVVTVNTSHIAVLPASIQDCRNRIMQNPRELDNLNSREDMELLSHFFQLAARRNQIINPAGNQLMQGIILNTEE